VSDGEEKKKQSALVWVLGGCGGVLVLGVCLTCVGPSAISAVMMGGDLFGSSVPPAMPATPVYPYDAAALTGGPVLPDPSGPIRPPFAFVDPSQDLRPRVVRFVVASASGAPGVTPGMECSAVVERRMRTAADYWCKTQVRCGDVLLYGGADHGFFPCQLLMNERRDVTGSDGETFASDGDGAFEIDTTVNRITVRDVGGALGEFSVVGDVTAIE
jgi:hypothetical protein